MHAYANGIYTSIRDRPNSWSVVIVLVDSMLALLSLLLFYSY